MLSLSCVVIILDCVTTNRQKFNFWVKDKDNGWTVQSAQRLRDTLEWLYNMIDDALQQNIHFITL